MNHNSKKRSFNEHNQAHQRDANQLFGDNPGEEHQQDDMHYRPDEAMVDDHIMDDEDDVKGSDDSQGEDLDDNIDADYATRPEMDNYEADGIDDADQEMMNAEDRRQAERQIDQQRRMMERGHQRQAAAFTMSDGENSEMQFASMRQRPDALDDQYEGGPDLGNINDYADQKENLAAWIQKDEVISFIRRKFGHFLRTFTDENQQHIYELRIQEMCQNNKQSIEVNFVHISNKQPTLAIWLAEEPASMLPILNEVAADIVSEVYPDYSKIHSEIFVRIRDLPVEDKLRDLRQLHLNALVKFRGVVTKRSGVFPQFYKMFLRCVCGDLKGPTYHATLQEAKQYAGTCITCQRAGPYQLDELETVYRNHQKLTIQETPGTVPPGRVPRQKECIVLHDLVDAARPGDEVEITGIYMNRYDQIANAKHGFPVFQTLIEVNNLKRFGDETIIELTDEDKQQIRSLSREPKIATKIFNSIAPSIYGHEFIKKGLCLAMFGGESKDMNGKHKIRGDINMLLLGDPGTAKSQFLKYIEKLYHRVVYTTGKGASAVGLTAGVHKDPVTGEWVLEGGALVLADKGICLIDEFDKMNEQDRTSIHEAMEQQSISISKAGIVTQLHARCSVIAAANPIGGVYKGNMNFNDNVDLTDPILSRFDLLTVIRDEATDDVDDALATFVLNSHMKSHPKVRQLKGQFDSEHEQQIMAELQKNLLQDSHVKRTDTSLQVDQDLLKKYIMYAKRMVHPKLNEIDTEKVTQFYAEIRRESNIVGGIPIAVRHIESVLRMSEAYAKIHLRDYVRSEDIDFAIGMLIESFLQSQKESVRRVLFKKFQKYLSKSEQNYSVLHHELEKLATRMILHEKMKRGVEDIDTVTVSLTVSQFKNELGASFDSAQVDQYVMSNKFRQDFRLEGSSKIVCTKTM